MAVQIGVQSFPMRAPSQFLPPPPQMPMMPPSSMVHPAVSFAAPQQVNAITTSSSESANLQILKPPAMPMMTISPMRGPSTGNLPPPGVIPGVPGGSFDGRRMRSKSTQRRTVDYNASLVNYLQVHIHMSFIIFILIVFCPDLLL